MSDENTAPSEEISSFEDIGDSNERSREIAIDPRIQNQKLKESQKPLDLVREIKDESIWYLDKDTIGKGEKPTFFHEKTFKTLAAQAEAYSKARKRIDDLSNKLDAKGEAPEDYKVALPEEFKDYDIDNEIVEKNLPRLKHWAKENKITNETFNGALGFFMNYLKEQKENDKLEIEKFNQEELEKIDPNIPEANRKLKELSVWVKQSYPKLNDETLKEMMNTNAAYKVLNHIREKGPKNQIPTDVPITQFEERNQLEKMMRDPRYANDMMYTSHVDKKWQDWGTRHGLNNH